MLTGHCYIYVNTAFYRSREVSKIGISKSVSDRLKEFNRGLRYREKHFPSIIGVCFSVSFSKKLTSRNEAKSIERFSHLLFKGKHLEDFGREVFDVGSDKAINIVGRALKETCL